VRGLSDVLPVRQTTCYVCMCREMWAGAGYVSDLTDIFIRHCTEPSLPNLPASNHTLGLTSVN